MKRCLEEGESGDTPGADWLALPRELWVEIWSHLPLGPMRAAVARGWLATIPAGLREERARDGLTRYVADTFPLRDLPHYHGLSDRGFLADFARQILQDHETQHQTLFNPFLMARRLAALYNELGRAAQQWHALQPCAVALPFFRMYCRVERLWRLAALAKGRLTPTRAELDVIDDAAAEALALARQHPMLFPGNQRNDLLNQWFEECRAKAAKL